MLPANTGEDIGRYIAIHGSLIGLARAFVQDRIVVIAGNRFQGAPTQEVDAGNVGGVCVNNNIDGSI